VTKTYGGNIWLSHSALFHSFSAVSGLLAGIKKETYDSKNELSTVKEGPTQRRTTIDLSFEEQLYLVKDHLILSPSLIYNHYSNDFGGPLPFTTKPVTAGENKNRGYLNRKMGWEIRIADFLSLKGNLGKYFRPPNFTELFGDRGAIVGNPMLKAEEGDNWDAGFTLQKGQLGIFRNIFFEYAFFESRLNNLILFIQNSQRTSVATNISKAVIRGHEVSWGSTLLNHFALSGNLTVQHTEDQSEVTYWEGHQLPGRPQFELFNRFECFNALGKIFYELNYLSNNYLDRANFKKVSARKIYNLGISIYPLKKLTLTFEIKNLSNARIEDVIGFPLPGRSYFATMDWKF